MITSPRLQVLLVEDDPDDLVQYERDLPDVFRSKSLEVDLHTCEDFDEALARSSDPLYRFDLIVSDTYRGRTGDGDAAVLRMVDSYRGHKFCPLVVYSSGVRPAELKEGPFLLWADKAKAGDIERAIIELIETSIPQLARTMHDELERAASTYLWEFLEHHWENLNTPKRLDSSVLERIVRRRASMQIADIDPDSGTGILYRDAAEYYVYPSFEHLHYNLGDVIISREDPSDLRVILTPHCHLFIQPGDDEPRADHVLLARALKAEEVLGRQLEKAKKLNVEKREKQLLSWGQSPAKSDQRPAGRHWYLPAFIEIPHSFCDFMQVESVTYEDLSARFQRIATLSPPYAEALQSCFANFYAAVGIPLVRTASIESMLD